MLGYVCICDFWSIKDDDDDDDDDDDHLHHHVTVVIHKMSRWDTDTIPGLIAPGSVQVSRLIIRAV